MRLPTLLRRAKPLFEEMVPDSTFEWAQRQQRDGTWQVGMGVSVRDGQTVRRAVMLVSESPREVLDWSPDEVRWFWQHLWRERKAIAKRLRAQSAWVTEHNREGVRHAL